MSENQGPFEIYEKDLDVVWINNPTAYATRRAALLAGANELTMLRAVIIQLHMKTVEQQNAMIGLQMKATSFDLMTEGVTTSDGKRFVFRPKD